ncbi:hypothetical protein [Corynebacterium callunae]|uniref:hypothetical protein n=1 Tax=Corynebacterium callunae TaxID=1721 RepID=UPI0004A4DCE0|nr:hypothetical protein [Corynebacterium callunae]MCK2200996.1 hypothetical protein [Corynebacterium callunae]
MNGQHRRTIRFFADWGANTPLWENGTENYLMSPEDYGLSESLSKRVYDWADHWKTHCHWERGWDSPSSKEESKIKGDAIVRDLRAEVATFADVIDER